MSVAETKPDDFSCVESDTPRSLLFISHANPEDNTVAAWYATRLTLLGYEVWCDLKNMQGGESAFWLKIQKKIKESAKFIFLLSDTSRDLDKKPGVCKELHAADNLRRDNFIIPVRINKVNDLPNMIEGIIYIDSENWMEGLTALKKRLERDNVPRVQKPNLERIISWWPAVSAQRVVLSDESSELVTNVFKFKSLPEKIHFLKVFSEGNLLTGYETLNKVFRKIPKAPAYQSFSNYAVSFGRVQDYRELPPGFHIQESTNFETEDFLEYGHLPLGLTPQIARNIVTHLVKMSLETFLTEKKLENKRIDRSRQKIWYPLKCTIEKDKHSFTERGFKKSFVSFVGHFTSRKKIYFWHFGVQPIVDLHTHEGVVFSPRMILSEQYENNGKDKKIFIDDKKLLSKVKWWNKEWRKKILGFAAWLADNEACMNIPTGYQTIVLSALPDTYRVEQTYKRIDDDSVIKKILGDCDEQDCSTL